MNNVDMLSGIPNIIIVEPSVVAFLNTPENQYVRLQIQKGLEFLSSDLMMPEAIDASDIASICKTCYMEAYKAGQVYIGKGKDTTEGYFSLGINDENGGPVCCEFVLDSEDAMRITRIAAIALPAGERNA